jgi:protein-S-isoprenylcysteine O-methyltransferase Ste14
MTMTRVTFAVISTLYLVVAIPWEERSLRESFGPAYAAYQRRVRWRMLPFLY